MCKVFPIRRGQQQLEKNQEEEFTEEKNNNNKLVREWESTMVDKETKLRCFSSKKERKKLRRQAFVLSFFHSLFVSYFAELFFLILTPMLSFVHGTYRDIIYLETKQNKSAVYIFLAVHHFFAILT